MTPERKESIKEFIELGDQGDTSRGYCEELLAALEEAQQQLRRTQITSSVHEGNSDAYFAECERLRGGLTEAQQQLANVQPTLNAERARGDKWEKAFDNADRQYLKQEKAAADLRRELTKFQALASDNHTLAARFERELAEAQQQREAATKLAYETNVGLESLRHKHFKQSEELVEAQQTIARQRYALEKVEKEMTNETTSRGRRVNFIIWEALGTQEGEQP
jgi:chromosome segregation ATPase